MSYLKFSYWFSHQNPVPSFWMYSLLTLFGLLIITAIVTTILSGRKSFIMPLRSLLSRVSVWAWFFSLTGFILLFFSVQQVAFLSARILYPLWAIGAGIWLYPIIRYATRDLPMRMEEQKEKLAREKYLPKRK